jgi:aromatic ring-opening dioxygenase LigB subunit
MKKEKIYIIPHPYDYHQQGEVLVRAKTKKEAIAKALRKINYDQGEFEY